MLYQSGSTSTFWSGGRPLALYDSISFLFPEASIVDLIPPYPDLPTQRSIFSDPPGSLNGVRLQLPELEEKQARLLLRGWLRKCWVERNEKPVPAVGIERRIEADRQVFSFNKKESLADFQSDMAHGTIALLCSPIAGVQHMAQHFEWATKQVAALPFPEGLVDYLRHRKHTKPSRSLLQEGHGNWSSGLAGSK